MMQCAKCGGPVAPPMAVCKSCLNPQEEKKCWCESGKSLKGVQTNFCPECGKEVKQEVKQEIKNEIRKVAVI